jgi:hypothetical protein
MALNKLARLFLVCCCALVISMSAFAQNGSHYTTTNTAPTMSDATSDCVIGKKQCWILLSSSTPTIQQLSVGGDESTYGLDANGNIWTLPANTHTWQSTALSPMEEIAVSSASNIYGLQVATSFCGLPEMQIYQYTGGTDFARFNYCAVHIGVGADGTLYRIRSSGNVTHLVNGTWISDPTAGGNGTPVKIAVGNQNNVWLVTSTGVIKTLDYANTGNFVVVPGWASDIATSGNPKYSDETVYVVGTTQSGANVYKYTSSTGALNGSWTELNGIVNKIVTAGYWQTLGVLTGSSSVYHLNSIMLSLTAQTQGYYDCNVFPNGCPLGSTHTATVKATWNSKGVGSNGSPSSGTPASTLNSMAYPYTEDCDPIFGDPNAPECQGTITGAVDCSAMGGIFGSTIRFHFKFTTTYWTGNMANPDGKCHYTFPACSSGTPTCTAATPGILVSPGCPTFVKVDYVSLNGSCKVSAGKAATGPGPCD